MCSISWQWDFSHQENSNLLSVWFNRDERRQRPIATSPSLYSSDGIEILMPTDPVAGGSWIAANKSGLVIALLNYYQAIPQANVRYRSRGLLVRSLSLAGSYQKARSLLDELVHSNQETKFAAFTLFFFDVSTAQTHAIRWDEKTLSEIELTKTFFSSSSWNSQEVLAFRDQQFEELVTSGKMKNSDYHRHTFPDKDAFTAFMSRPETQTVSITEIIATKNSLTMDYEDRNTGVSSSNHLPLHIPPAASSH
ncbi:NRDE family protein [Akkermansiaceae bacterium]|nr:NRDE family protein [Akkermansiaceae bacterium]